MFSAMYVGRRSTSIISTDPYIFFWQIAYIITVLNGSVRSGHKGSFRGGNWNNKVSTL